MEKAATSKIQGLLPNPEKPNLDTTNFPSYQVRGAPIAPHPQMAGPLTRSSSIWSLGRFLEVKIKASVPRDLFPICQRESVISLNPGRRDEYMCLHIKAHGSLQAPSFPFHNTCYIVKAPSSLVFRPSPPPSYRPFL